ncbi:MAG: type II secretion system protein GspL [Steroidobacteraceae bacterium]
MSETLVIRVRASDAAQASWVIVDANGARSGPLQSGPVADALSAAQQRSVILLVPGADVTLAEPELPVRNTSRLAQAVPYALEEQLASDVEDLHFAVGPRPAGSANVPVAVVAKATMDRWIGACADAGIQPDAAYADSSAVPVTAGGTTLLLDGATLYVRRHDALPYALDTGSPEDAIALAVGESAGETGHLVFYASPSDYERHRELIEGLRTRAESLQVKLMPDGPLPLLAAQATGSNGVDLLQGAYASQGSVAAGLRRWRLPAALAAGIVLVYVVGHAITAVQLHRAERALDAQMAQVFQQAMPGQKAVDPRAQMQGMLGGAAGPSALLPTLSALSHAVAGSPQTQVQAITCRAGVVDLRVNAPSVGALDGLKQSLQSAGLNAELQSATPRGGTVEGRLVVRLAQS